MEEIDIEEIDIEEISLDDATKIQVDDMDGTVRVFVGGSRVIFCFQLGQCKVLCDRDAELYELIPNNTRNIQLYLKGRDECETVAKFVGCKIYEYDHSGNNLVEID